MAKQGSKVELGQFYTTANPFTHPRARRWIEEIGPGKKWLEPFAGANHIVHMINAIAGEQRWESFDIEPGDPTVHQRDVLADFPQGFDVVATNPPYLAKNSARRRGYTKALTVMGEWDDLYLRCIDTCLRHVPHVAAIIPESFIANGKLRERLDFVISLNQIMFTDTEHPVCLAVFGPQDRDDFEVWVGERLIGTWGGITERGTFRSRGATMMRFNDPRGKVGLLAVDNTREESIRFVPAREVPKTEIKHSSRHRTRIHVPGLTKRNSVEVGEVLDEANRILARWRRGTGDVLLSPFMGLREDGYYRRRLDYATAGSILGQAIETCERRNKRVGKLGGAHNRKRSGG